MDRVLRGACACGRNRYVVEIPQASSQVAQVFFDNSSVNRRHLASPFTAWLRVPLDWYHSSTYALFPDETHRSIRRTFVSPFPFNTLRQFCGYCGTQLTSWNERTREDANYISLTLGSLLDEDLERLVDLGLLPPENGSDEEVSAASMSLLQPQSQTQRQVQTALARPLQGSLYRGAPWFESMVEDTRLGRIKRQRGGHTSADGSVQVEWEVVEWTADDEAQPGTPGKRKIEEMEAEQTDVDMRGT